MVRSEVRGNKGRRSEEKNGIKEGEVGEIREREVGELMRNMWIGSIIVKVRKNCGRRIKEKWQSTVGEM